jgi:magnesium transporter
MITTVYQEEGPDGRLWLDVVDPTPEELDSLASNYGLHHTLVADCLQPLHLPKHEQVDNVTFVIVRAFDELAALNETSVQALTRKIALFLGERFLITVHRKDQTFLANLRAKYRNPKRSLPLQTILLEVLIGAIETYRQPLDAAEQEAQAFETAILTNHQDDAHWDVFFRTQAQLTVIKRLFWHTRDAVQKLDLGTKPILSLRQDLRERIDSLQFFADTLLDDLRNLLAVQLALASHGTNKVMRTLTVFSVIFMPLTFVVGVYGMNFRYMPELNWRYGYFVVICLLILLSAYLVTRFRKRGWL